MCQERKVNRFRKVCTVIMRERHVIRNGNIKEEEKTISLEVQTLVALNSVIYNY